MNWHNKVVCCIIALCISGYVQVQRIAGKVVDEANVPWEFASIVPLSAMDSAFVQGRISNEDGSFQFLKAEEKEYILKVGLITNSGSEYDASLQAGVENTFTSVKTLT